MKLLLGSKDKNILTGLKKHSAIQNVFSEKMKHLKEGVQAAHKPEPKSYSEDPQQFFIDLLVLNISSLKEAQESEDSQKVSHINIPFNSPLNTPQKRATPKPKAAKWRVQDSKMISSFSLGGEDKYRISIITEGLQVGEIAITRNDLTLVEIDQDFAKKIIAALEEEKKYLDSLEDKALSNESDGKNRKSNLESVKFRGNDWRKSKFALLTKSDLSQSSSSQDLNQETVASETLNSASNNVSTIKIKLAEDKRNQLLSATSDRDAREVLSKLTTKEIENYSTGQWQEFVIYLAMINNSNLDKSNTGGLVQWKVNKDASTISSNFHLKGYEYEISINQNPESADFLTVSLGKLNQKNVAEPFAINDSFARDVIELLRKKNNDPNTVRRDNVLADSLAEASEELRQEFPALFALSKLSSNSSTLTPSKSSSSGESSKDSSEYGDDVDEVGLKGDIDGMLNDQTPKSPVRASKLPVRKKDSASPLNFGGEKESLTRIPTSTGIPIARRSTLRDLLVEDSAEGSHSSSQDDKSREGSDGEWSDYEDAAEVVVDENRIFDDTSRPVSQDLDSILRDSSVESKDTGEGSLLSSRESEVIPEVSASQSRPITTLSDEGLTASGHNSDSESEDQRKVTKKALQERLLQRVNTMQATGGSTATAETESATKKKWRQKWNDITAAQALKKSQEDEERKKDEEVVGIALTALADTTPEEPEQKTYINLALENLFSEAVEKQVDAATASPTTLLSANYLLGEGQEPDVFSIDMEEAEEDSESVSLESEGSIASDSDVEELQESYLAEVEDQMEKDAVLDNPSERVTTLGRGATTPPMRRKLMKIDYDPDSEEEDLEVDSVDDNIEAGEVVADSLQDTEQEFFSSSVNDFDAFLSSPPSPTTPLKDAVAQANIDDILSEIKSTDDVVTAIKEAVRQLSSSTEMSEVMIIFKDDILKYKDLVNRLIVFAATNENCADAWDQITSQPLGTVDTITDPKWLEILDPETIKFLAVILPDNLVYGNQGQKSLLNKNESELNDYFSKSEVKVINSLREELKELSSNPENDISVANLNDLAQKKVFSKRSIQIAPDIVASTEDQVVEQPDLVLNPIVVQVLEIASKGKTTNRYMEALRLALKDLEPGDISPNQEQNFEEGEMMHWINLSNGSAIQFLKHNSELYYAKRDSTDFRDTVHSPTKEEVQEYAKFLKVENQYLKNVDFLEWEKPQRAVNASAPSPSPQSPTAEKIAETTLYKPVTIHENSIWNPTKTASDRGNKLKVVNGVYGGENEDDQSAIEQTLLDIIATVADKHGLGMEKVLDIIKQAREQGGIKNKWEEQEGRYNPTNLTDREAKIFSRDFQRECEACGILSGRGNSHRGLRTTFIPLSVTQELESLSEGKNSKFMEGKVEDGKIVVSEEMKDNLRKRKNLVAEKTVDRVQDMHEV